MDSLPLLPPGNPETIENQASHPKSLFLMECNPTHNRLTMTACIPNHYDTTVTSVQWYHLNAASSTCISSTEATLPVTALYHDISIYFSSFEPSMLPSPSLYR